MAAQPVGRSCCACDEQTPLGASAELVEVLPESCHELGTGGHAAGLTDCAVLQLAFLPCGSAVGPCCSRHLVGVVHRDLTPAGLGQVKISLPEIAHLGWTQCCVVHAREVGTQRRCVPVYCGQKRPGLIVVDDHSRVDGLRGLLPLDRQALQRTGRHEVQFDGVP